MHILFADKFPQFWLDRLTEIGHQIHFSPDLSDVDLHTAIESAEILVVRSTKVDATTLENGKSLRLVIRAGAGTNTIDRDCARERGIPVCNTPGRNAVAVAELAMGLIIALDRRIPDNVSDLKRGTWNKQEYSRAAGLYGATLAVLGTGAIGIELIRRAHAFGMRIAVIGKPGRDPATRRCLEEVKAIGVADLSELASMADFLSIHLPGGDDTRGIVGAEVFHSMKPGAAIINTSRGDVVDEAALIDAMNQKGLRAGLDVFQNEPGAFEPNFESNLAAHPNVYGTHHIGASTRQAQDAVAEGVFDVVTAFADGTTINCVNQVA